MRRLIIHLLVALITFFTGIYVKVMLTVKGPLSPHTNLQEVRLPTQIGPEMSAAFDSARPATNFVLGYDPEEFNPRGTYYLIERKPNDLREFDCFELVVEERDGRASGDATLYTRYYGKNKDYHIITGNGDYILRGLLTKERLTFVALPKSEEDFEFRFDGHFLRGGMVSDAGQNTAVLKGRLTKLKDGVRVAEREVKLRVEYLGC